MRVALRYLEAWLEGRGCVPIDHLMEDAATAEISRSQIWQWIHHGVSLAEGSRVTAELVRDVVPGATLVLPKRAAATRRRRCSPPLSGVIGCSVPSRDRPT